MYTDYASCVFTYLYNAMFNSEVNAGIFYATAEEREKMVKAERKFTDEKVQKIIELKKKVSILLSSMTING